jgi:hypothetical protein
VKNAGCDGIYLDDISYDRTIMRRARRILDTNPRGGLIDLHSWNEMNTAAGFASCALIFMDSFPFLDRLWLGEGHHYDGPAEQTLVAISGVPFGLMGEMLEHGGNPWLGLTFGMTGRKGWQGAPEPVWKLWNEFGVAGSEFIGWWDSENPVKATNPACRATIWRRDGKTLIAVANFSDQPARTQLGIDFSKLGINPQKAHLYAPAVKAFQFEAVITPDAAIEISPKRGFAFILDESPREGKRAASVVTPDPKNILAEERFPGPGLPPAWKIVASPIAIGFKPGKDGLTLEAPANVHAWIARDWVPGAAGVAVQLQRSSTDEGQQWGAGVALVWPGERLLKVNLRRDGRFGLSINGQERLAGECDPTLPVTLALRMEEDAIRVTAGGPAVGSQGIELARVPRSEFPGLPAEVRIGKMPNSGQAQDHGTPGGAGVSTVQSILFLR